MFLSLKSISFTETLWLVSPMDLSLSKHFKMINLINHSQHQKKKSNSLLLIFITKINSAKFLWVCMCVCEEEFLLVNQNHDLSLSLFHTGSLR